VVDIKRLAVTNKTMSRNPEADQATLRAVYDAARGGRHAHAAELAESALNAGLEHPLLLNVVALGLEQEGRLPEAVRMLERAVQLAPSDLGSRNALGLCLLRLERPREALEQFDTILKASPGVPYAHTSRGNSLLALGEIGHAEASFRSALDIDSAQSLALAGLAHIARSRGEYAEAREWADKALERVPGLPSAVMSLAAADLHQRRASEAESRLRELVGDARLSDLERAHATGLLGDALDAQSRPAEAFAAYEACNQTLQRLYAGRYGGDASALAYARGLLGYFELAAPEIWKVRPAMGPDFSGARGHVFLLGFPRSGTTLLEVILEGHASVVSLEEQELLIDSVQQFMQRPQSLDGLLRATPAMLETARSAYWRRVAQGGANVAGKVFVDKYPLNTLKLPLIARLFPDAKILLAGRDPRDIVLSSFRHRFAMSAPIYELLSIEGAARYYDAVMQLLIRFTTTLRLDTCLVRHEDLVTGFAREMKRICAFLGIDWDPAMGDFALRTRNRAVLTPSTAQLVRGLNTEGLGQWRRYHAQLAPVLPLLKPWIERFLYDPA
jgi:tetratricopeptide (TPR) repeat protein